ncbi:hypothetical protein [Amycolatopsis sp. cmx-4-83]|uniref:hypothetical protein n=1 Tax=Amycolatopsis sp. cmx-4-83 TaxID=2790940 RepID=UPI003978A998
MGLVEGMISLAGTVGSRFGYGGQWQFVVGVTNMAGVASAKATRTSFVDIDAVTRYSGTDHVAGTTAVTGELRERPGAVTKRLMYRFVRALGVEGDYVEKFAG